ncbi:maleylpyruvate isomerase family mycothiol-dependent enzyme [Glycomyces tenuis]|uniref:maleylpyruvate isomerase family mycothiol-dependent enzyme n=1 Tax=Glycomyces tenuis TaxID=58116 RepID=UPI0003F65F90|nr:maleylpyruvate isomerase family mycothiol-dependent enzyme [Glycomyces tenuis]
MNIGDQINVLRTEGERIAIAGGELALNAAVPTCPGWSVKDLLTHIGTVHRWATAIVARALAHDPRQRDFQHVVGPLPHDELLVDWVRLGLGELVETLEAAPDDLQCWQVFASESSKRFWVRRQAHETTIHRVDAEQARGDEISPVNRDFAADGIDELLLGFHGRPTSRVRALHPSVLHIHAIDLAPGRGDWYIHPTDAGPLVTFNEVESPHCTIEGPVELLYLALWNRLPFDDLTVSGDPALLQLWRNYSAVRWVDPVSFSN